jgi:hypothetical protein
LYHIPKFIRKAATHRLLVVASLLVAIAVSFVGIPTALPAKIRNERFPCEDCPCGCESADFCWDRCCCHTDTEKLAWAERNNVVPPSFVVKRVGKSIRNQIATNKKPSCCCCRSEKQGVLETAKATNRTPKSLAKNQPPIDTAAKCSDAGTVDSRSGELDFVLVWKAASCRGLKQGWSFLSGLVIDVPQAIHCFAAMPSDRIVLVDETAVSWMQPPAPPVPWRMMGLAFSSSPLPRV